ncbi:hypothetical protein BV25DRAFT_1843137 [Artomyces pyxidatus]|uniref:Uncharacterized protein n=1 Tax=Artomyces pyxidatus TaxID=48021 RepID=A0ACB8SG21_9AGAM|nr:hypothetical protein BV25DRAFT_1843137 [Artomyces pyxidatus]
MSACRPHMLMQHRWTPPIVLRVLFHPWVSRHVRQARGHEYQVRLSKLDFRPLNASSAVFGAARSCLRRLSPSKLKISGKRHRRVNGKYRDMHKCESVQGSSRVVPTDLFGLNSRSRGILRNSGASLVHLERRVSAPDLIPSTYHSPPHRLRTAIGSYRAYLDDAVDRYIQWEDSKELGTVLHLLPDSLAVHLEVCRVSYVVPYLTFAVEVLLRVHTHIRRGRRRGMMKSSVIPREAAGSRVGVLRTCDMNQPRQASKFVPKGCLRQRVEVLSHPAPTVCFSSRLPFAPRVAVSMCELEERVTTRPAKRAHEYMASKEAESVPWQGCASRTGRVGETRLRDGAPILMWRCFSASCQTGTHERRAAVRLHGRTKLLRGDDIRYALVAPEIAGLMALQRRHVQANPPTPQHAARDSPARGLHDIFGKVQSIIRRQDKHQRGERGEIRTTWQSIDPQRQRRLLSALRGKLQRRWADRRGWKGRKCWT